MGSLNSGVELPTSNTPPYSVSKYYGSRSCKHLQKRLALTENDLNDNGNSENSPLGLARIHARDSKRSKIKQGRMPILTGMQNPPEGFKNYQIISWEDSL